MATEAIFYRATQYTSDFGRYSHLMFDLYMVPADSKHDTKAMRYSSPLLTVRWQSGGIENHNEWYAFSMECRASRVDQLSRAARLARRIFGNDDVHYDINPGELIAILRRKATEVVYDGRLREFVGAEDLMGPEWHAFSDDYEALGVDGSWSRVLARNESEAARLIRIDLAEQGRTDHLALFIANGEPVRRVNESETDFRFVDEKVAAVA